MSKRSSGRSAYERARERVALAYRHVRPLVMVVAILSGTGWAEHMLDLYPWHHLTFAWIAGVALAGYGGAQLYNEVRDRLVVLQWLRLDKREALASVEDVRVALRQLPTGYRGRFLTRLRQLESEAGGRSRARAGSRS